MAPSASDSEKDEVAGEEAAYLARLRRRGRVIEAECEDVDLPPGVTHVLVRDKDGKQRLVERRKS